MEVDVEGLAADDEALDLMPHRYMITDHFSSKVLICLDLEYSLSRQGHCDFTVVRNKVSIILQP